MLTATLILLMQVACGHLIQSPPLMDQPLLSTNYGPVLGSHERSLAGRTYASFKAIPYAQPPVGNLRFRAPQPPRPWMRTVLDARQDAPFCIQQNTLFETLDTVSGQEDCLYLNVYTSAMTTSGSRPRILLPVMVFLHYGAFFSGRSASDHLGPEYLMDKDVILVTANYRLGVFGFLTTLDDASPGNYAFKDQVAALEWVHDNIASFGGDPEQVTLFGASAGAGSVHMHMLSPLSKGLFHRAISQSGTALNLWLKPLNAIQKNVTLLQASLVNCDKFADDSHSLIRCLRRVDARTLAASASKFKYFFNEPLTPFTIVTEQQSLANPRPFITKDPVEYVKNGDFHNVPWIVGTVGDEGILRAAPLIRQLSIRQRLNAIFDQLAPQLLMLALSTLNVTHLWDNIKQYYLQGSNYVDVNNASIVQGFIDLYSDRAFVYGTYESVKLQSTVSHSPIWMYSFNYRGRYSYGDVFALTNETIDFNWGVCHLDDLIYLFQTPVYFPPLRDYSDKYMRTVLVQIWTNFAIYGHPDPLLEIPWTPVQKNADYDTINFLNISGSVNEDNLEMLMETGFHVERMKFWRSQMVLENSYL